MIIPVTNENEVLWDGLCVKLWPEHSAGDFLALRTAGQLENEFLYMQNGKAVAFLSLSLRHDYVEGTNSSPVGYVEGIYVKPDFRKQGIAAKLIDFAKQWAMAKGCKEIASDCEIENKQSRAFHNAAGFEEAGTIVCFKMKI